MTAFEDYVREQLERRLLHRLVTEKPFEECGCSEGGRCEPLDPAKRQVLPEIKLPGIDKAARDQGGGAVSDPTQNHEYVAPSRRTLAVNYAPLADLLEDIGPELRRVRKARGMDQQWVAVEMGVSEFQLSRWETGKTLPSLGMSVRILRWMAGEAKGPVEVSGG